MAITITGQNDNIAANAFTADVLSGEKGRFVEEGDVIRLYTVGSANTFSVEFGTAVDIFVATKRCPYVGTTLITSDHLIGEFTASSAGELSMRFLETGGVATTDVIWKVEVLQQGVDF